MTKFFKFIFAQKTNLYTEKENLGKIIGDILGDASAEIDQ